MGIRLRRDDGVSTLELALVLPVLLLLLATALPLVVAGWQYLVLTRATAHGVRYASRVEANARLLPDGTLTRRPSAGEVADYVQEAAHPIALESVEVDPEPSRSLPGEPIRVTVRYEVTIPLAGVANQIKSLFFPGASPFPESTVVTVSARGREE